MELRRGMPSPLLPIGLVLGQEPGIDAIGIDLEDRCRVRCVILVQGVPAFSVNWCEPAGDHTDNGSGRGIVHGGVSRLFGGGHWWSNHPGLVGLVSCSEGRSTCDTHPLGDQYLLELGR